MATDSVNKNPSDIMEAYVGCRECKRAYLPGSNLDRVHKGASKYALTNLRAQTLLDFDSANICFCWKLRSWITASSENAFTLDK